MSPAPSNQPLPPAHSLSEVMKTFIGGCSDLAREHLEEQGATVTSATLEAAEAALLPGYVARASRFLRDHGSSLTREEIDAAFFDALTTLLRAERLAVATALLQEPSLPISVAVRRSLAPLAEYVVTSRVREGRPEHIVELARELNLPLTSPKYCDALRHLARTTLRDEGLDGLARVFQLGMPWPEPVIYQLRSDVEDALLLRMHRRDDFEPLRVLMKPFMLADFLQSDRYYGALSESICRCFLERDLMAANTLIRKFPDMPVSRDLQDIARRAIEEARGEYHYFRTEPDAGRYAPRLAVIAEGIHETVRHFRLDAHLARDIPHPGYTFFTDLPDLSSWPEEGLSD